MHCSLCNNQPSSRIAHKVVLLLLLFAVAVPLCPVSPKNITVSVRPTDILMGGSVTLTCSNYAKPRAGNYTWFKVNESTPVVSGKQYSITNIRSEDGVQYYCEARNTYGAGNSSIVSVIVEGISASLSLCAYDNNCLRSLLNL